MSVLVVGLSHRSAPVPILERAALTGDAQGKLLRDVFHCEFVAGTFAVSTCNRVEVYAEVDKFHAGVSVICEMLARHTGIALPELTPHLYVHYEDRAVQHLLSMICGLESMVVGESQILGQVRRALTVARKHQTLGHTLRSGSPCHLHDLIGPETACTLGPSGDNCVSSFCCRECPDGMSGAEAGAARCLASWTAPKNARTTRPRASRSSSICAMTTSRADWLIAVMSPNPTVLKMVIVK